MSCSGNICVRVGEAEKVVILAITVDSILCFGQMTDSTPLLQFCGERGISVTFLTENGKFQGRFYGPVSGNVLLRKRQYESLHDDVLCVQFVRTLLYAKIRNAKLVLMRAARNCDDCERSGELEQVVTRLTEAAQQLSQCESVDSMRGIEGAAATAYFSQFDTMLMHNPGGFRFETRSRRPPRNAANAALSFTYMLLANQTQSTMEAVGLDPVAGYLHTLRPGQAPLPWI